MTKLLIKHNDKPSNKYGIEPKNRTIKQLLDKGFINIDKDKGPTSHIVADTVKKILNIKKVGHSGTLDPKVTGVLLMGLGKATRLMEYMLKSNKEYICLMYVHKKISKSKIEKVLKQFTGEIIQIPPIISAVKRQPRKRTIYELELLDYENNGQNILFRVRCQHGTYIRKLCSDIGETLKIGAQMKELRRTKAGPITEKDNIISLDKLRNLYELYNEETDEKNKLKIEQELKKYIQPMEYLLKEYKKVYLRDSAVNPISKGADLAIPGVAKLDDNIELGDEIAMLTLKGELIGIGTAFLTSKQVIKKNKGAFIKTNKILMNIDYYPKTWDFKNQN